MTIKAKLIFGDVLMLIGYVFMALVLLMKWSQIIFFLAIPLLIFRGVLRRGFDVKYPYGKVSIFFLVLMVIFFVSAVVTVFPYRVNYFVYSAWPNWHRYLVVLALVTGSLSMVFRVLQDRKFSENKECK